MYPLTCIIDDQMPWFESKYFSKLDLVNGFWQLHIDADTPELGAGSERLTTLK